MDIFNVVKVPTHPDVHLINVHFLPPSCSHQWEETADFSCSLLIFPVGVCVQEAAVHFTCVQVFSVTVCADCSGGRGAAGRTDEHRGEGAAAPADVATPQSENGLLAARERHGS